MLTYLLLQGCKMLCPGGLTGNKHGKQPLACMRAAFRGCVPCQVYTAWDVAIYGLTQPLPAFPFDFCPGTLLDLEQDPEPQSETARAIGAS